MVAGNVEMGAFLSFFFFSCLSRFEMELSAVESGAFFFFGGGGVCFFLQVFLLSLSWWW